MKDYTYLVTFYNEDGEIVAEENHTAHASCWQDAADWVSEWATKQLSEFDAAFFEMV